MGFREGLSAKNPLPILYTKNPTEKLSMRVEHKGEDSVSLSSSRHELKCSFFLLLFCNFYISFASYCPKTVIKSFITHTLLTFNRL